MNKKLFVLLSVLSVFSVLFSFSSCSFVMDKIDSKLDEMGLSDEGEKIKDAWNEIGKDALNDAADDILCGLEFRSEKTWPEEGVAALVPRPYYNKLDSVKCADDRGIICISSFTKYESRKYIELLNKEGFEKYSDAVPVVYINLSNGVAVCPVYTEESEKLDLLYADGFASVSLLIKETFS